MTGPEPAVEHYRQIIERGSRSFARAASLLEPRVRAGGYQLYAWCRHCDDLIDGQVLGHLPADSPPPDPDRQRAQLAELRALTTQALAGQPSSDPAFQGLARIFEQYDIPRHHPFELLDGMAMDVELRRYRNIDELIVYCYYVAGVVGVMMAHIIGIRDPATLKRAEDLGIAMQLTNIARDVMDDARGGRVYLPLDWLSEAGVDPEQVRSVEHRHRIATVVKRLLAVAETRYQRADQGIAHLPFRSAWSIAAARSIYADIGRVIVARGEQAWDRRAMVPAWRKYLLVAASLARTMGRTIRP